MTVNIDAQIKNADWPKRTPDKFEDLVQKYDPAQAREPKGSPKGGEFTFANIRGVPTDIKGVEQRLHGTSAAAMRQEPLPETVEAAENRIRHEPNEHAFLIRDGKPFKVLGNNDDHHVRMGDATDEDLKDAVLTHNHPSGYGLSNQDGVTAAVRNMLEMRAVTVTGTYSIKRIGTEWPQNFVEAIQEMHRDLMFELGMRIHDNDINIAEANTLHHRLMYQRLQKKLGGFTYTFEPKHES